MYFRVVCGLNACDVIKVSEIDTDTLALVSPYASAPPLTHLETPLSILRFLDTVTSIPETQQHLVFATSNLLILLEAYAICYSNLHMMESGSMLRKGTV